MHWQLFLGVIRIPVRVWTKESRMHSVGFRCGTLIYWGYDPKDNNLHLGAREQLPARAQSHTDAGDFKIGGR